MGLSLFATHRRDGGADGGLRLQLACGKGGKGKPQTALSLGNGSLLWASILTLYRYEYGTTVLSFGGGSVMDPLPFFLFHPLPPAMPLLAPASR